MITYECITYITKDFEVTYCRLKLYIFGKVRNLNLTVIICYSSRPLSSCILPANCHAKWKGYVRKNLPKWSYWHPNHKKLEKKIRGSNIWSYCPPIHIWKKFEFNINIKYCINILMNSQFLISQQSRIFRCRSPSAYLSHFFSSTRARTLANHHAQQLLPSPLYIKNPMKKIKYQNMRNHTSQRNLRMGHQISIKGFPSSIWTTTAPC